jgi:hypothetical protein
MIFRSSHLQGQNPEWRKAGTDMHDNYINNPLPDRTSVAAARLVICKRLSRSRIFPALLAAGLALLAVPAAQAEQFDPPDMEGFILHSERDADGDRMAATKPVSAST